MGGREPERNNLLPLVLNQLIFKHKHTVFIKAESNFAWKAPVKK